MESQIEHLMIYRIEPSPRFFGGGMFSTIEVSFDECLLLNDPYSHTLDLLKSESFDP